MNLAKPNLVVNNFEPEVGVWQPTEAFRKYLEAVRLRREAASSGSNSDKTNSQLTDSNQSQSK